MIPVAEQPPPLSQTKPHINITTKPLFLFLPLSSPFPSLLCVSLSSLCLPFFSRWMPVPLSVLAPPLIQVPQLLYPAPFTGAFLALPCFLFHCSSLPDSPSHSHTEYKAWGQQLPAPHAPSSSQKSSSSPVVLNPLTPKDFFQRERGKKVEIEKRCPLLVQPN